VDTEIERPLSFAIELKAAKEDIAKNNFYPIHLDLTAYPERTARRRILPANARRGFIDPSLVL